MIDSDSENPTKSASSEEIDSNNKSSSATIQKNGKLINR